MTRVVSDKRGSDNSLRNRSTKVFQEEIQTSQHSTILFRGVKQTVIHENFITTDSGKVMKVDVG